VQNTIFEAEKLRRPNSDSKFQSDKVHAIYEA